MTLVYELLAGLFNKVRIGAFGSEDLFTPFCENKSLWRRVARWTGPVVVDLEFLQLDRKRLVTTYDDPLARPR